MSYKTRVISIIAPLLIGFGGANRFLATLAIGLRKRGYEVQIYSLVFEQERTFKEFKEVSVVTRRRHWLCTLADNIVKYGIVRWGRILSPPLLMPALIVELLLVLKAYFRNKPHAIFVNGNHTLIGLLTPFLRKCRFVCYYHSLPPTLEWKNLPVRLLRAFEKFTMLKCIAIANSTFTAQAIKREIGIDVKIVHPGCDISRFENLDRKDDGKSMVYVARIHPDKRQYFLIHVMHKMHEVGDLNDFKLILCGGGDSEPYLLRLHKLIRKLKLEDGIIIIKNFDDKLLPELLSKCTLYLHPSIETFGISIVEAMAAGLPAIVYDHGGQRDIVSHGVDGFLAGDDIEEWTRYINKLLTNRTLLREMSEAARRKAMDFSLERMIDKLEDYLA
jgi:glycosyltransferase involved in cell wall biosynthesis